MESLRGEKKIRVAKWRDNLMLHAAQSVRLHSVEQRRPLVIGHLIKAAKKQSEAANIRGWILAITALLDWIGFKDRQCFKYLEWCCLSGDKCNGLFDRDLSQQFTNTHTHTLLSLLLFPLSLSLVWSRCHCASWQCLNGVWMAHVSAEFWTGKKKNAQGSSLLLVLIYSLL